MFVQITQDIANPMPMKAGEIRELPKEWLRPDAMLRLGPILNVDQAAVLIPWPTPLNAE